MGGSFAVVGDRTYLTVDYSFYGTERGRLVTVEGATSNGNNGTFEVIELVGASTLGYLNPVGVAEPFGPSTTWRIDQNHSGRASAYMSRGYRIGGVPPTNALVVMLPYGTTDAQLAAVMEVLRLKKAAGFKVLVERRLTPPPPVAAASADPGPPRPPVEPEPDAAPRRPWLPDPSDGRWP